MDLGYSIGIGIEDLASSPASRIAAALRQVDSVFDSLRSSMSGVNFSTLRQGLTGVSATATRTEKRIGALRTELSQMKDFRATLKVGIDDSLLREVDIDIARIEKSITRLSNRRVAPTIVVSEIDKLKTKLASLEAKKQVGIQVNANAADLLKLDIEIGRVRAELHTLERPTNVNVTGSNSVNRLRNSFTGLTGAINTEANSASRSATANANFVNMLNGITPRANASARSIDRLDAEIRELTNHRNTLDINVNAREIIRANGQIRTLENQIRRTQGQSNGGWFQNIMSGGAMAFFGGNLMFSAVSGIISGVKSAFTGAMDLESTKVSYGTFSQNKAVKAATENGKPFDEAKVRTQALEQSNGTIAELNKYADATSFENGDLLKVGAKMSGYMDQNKIVGKMKQFGDISGGDVGKLNSLELVYSQVKDAGKMQGQDLMQLINGGAYGIMEELAKVKGVKVNEIRGQMKDGLISFADVDKALTNMTSKGGNFFGVMDAQSKTVMGRLSTMIGTIKTKMNEFMMGQNFPVLNQIIDLGTAIISNIELIGKPIMNLVTAFQPVTNAIGNVFSKLTGGATLAESVSAIFGAFGGVIDFLAGGINVLANVIGYLIESPIVQWIGGIITAGYALSGVMALINIVMSANPLVLFVGGLILVGAGLKALWDNCETFRDVVMSVYDGVKIAWEGIKAVFTNTIAGITERIDKFTKFFSGIWDMITNPAKASFSGVLDVVSNVLKAIVDLFVNFNPFTLAFKLASGLREGIQAGLKGVKVNAEIETSNAKISRKIQELKQGGGAELIPSSLKGVNNNKGLFQAPFPTTLRNGKENPNAIKKPPKNNINEPFGGKDRDKKGKSIGDKSGINKTVEGTKPTVVNVTFGSIIGANNLTQNLSGNDTQSKASEIVDLVVEQLIRRIGTSVAIAGI